MKPTINKQKLKAYNAREQKYIVSALEFATQAHGDQVRRSGLPYISHPIAVAEYLMDLKMDVETVAAALLHDTVEDTPITPEDLAQKFGPAVASLVDGVTKIGQVDYAPSTTVGHRQSSSIENVRKLLFAMSSDLRVIMIKLADRRHNLTTLEYLAEPDRTRIAQESLDIFAPLADRLGMGILKSEIEDMAFSYTNPKAYSLVKKLVADNIPESQAYLDRLGQSVQNILKDEKIKAISVHGRRKHLMSVYRKLTKADGDITKIYDLTALRIIVPSEADCYQVLGVLHKHYKPLIYRIKDYIAVPKPNGYRSLHTTVFAAEGKIIEIQIRTPAMHDEAEHGLAAHALYNAHKDTKGYVAGKGAESNHKLAWIGELASASAGNEGAPDLLENLKVDFFRDRIFVFSPMGDLYDLPEGATPLDFAFAVHTDIGLRTQGVKVNGRIVPLERPLENRDVVEVLTRKVAHPSRHWVSIVKTSSARSKIKAWFRASSRDSNVATGKELLEAQLPSWGLRRLEDVDKTLLARVIESFNLKDKESLLAAIGEGSVHITTVLRRLIPPARSSEPESNPKNQPFAHTGRMYVLGAPELPCAPASCCQPSPPVPLVGYITRGSGITVHMANCANLPAETDRLVDCGWEQVLRGHRVESALKIVCYNRVGLVHDVTGVIAASGTNIVKISTYDDKVDSKKAWIEVHLQIGDLFSLGELTHKLINMSDIIEVQRASVKEL